MTEFEQEEGPTGEALDLVSRDREGQDEEGQDGNPPELTPRDIVRELDKYIVGQDNAKKAVAISLRNRWRRQQVEGELREEILPNNLILIGPTGVGKTEISRRLARLAGAPFVKVEASKFTEVGYVGRDVESMIRDLVDTSVNMVRAEREAEVEEEADRRVEERLLDLLLPITAGPQEAEGEASQEPGEALEKSIFVAGPSGVLQTSPDGDGPESPTLDRRSRTREKLRKLLKDGVLEDREVERSEERRVGKECRSRWSPYH